MSLTPLEIELLTALEKANWHLSDFHSDNSFSNELREKVLEPVIDKARWKFHSKEGQGMS